MPKKLAYLEKERASLLLAQSEHLSARSLIRGVSLHLEREGLRQALLRQLTYLLRRRECVRGLCQVTHLGKVYLACWVHLPAKYLIHILYRGWEQDRQPGKKACPSRCRPAGSCGILFQYIGAPSSTRIHEK